MPSFLKVTGMQELQDTLMNIAPREARNLMRATVQQVASNIAKDAKKNAPRDKGILQKAIKAKRKKSPPNSPASQVLVGTGKKERYDAYYWKFKEYGTVNMKATPFIGPAKQRAQQNMKQMLVTEFGKKLEKSLARQAKKAGGT